MPDTLIEKSYGWPKKIIAGIDEAGRGPSVSYTHLTLPTKA